MINGRSEAGGLLFEEGDALFAEGEGDFDAFGAEDEVFGAGEEVGDDLQAAQVGVIGVGGVWLVFRHGGFSAFLRRPALR